MPSVCDLKVTFGEEPLEIFCPLKKWVSSFLNIVWRLVCEFRIQVLDWMYNLQIFSPSFYENYKVIVLSFIIFVNIR